MCCVRDWRPPILVVSHGSSHSTVFLRWCCGWPCVVGALQKEIGLDWLLSASGPCPLFVAARYHSAAMLEVSKGPDTCTCMLEFCTACLYPGVPLTSS